MKSPQFGCQYSASDEQEIKINFLHADYSWKCRPYFIRLCNVWTANWATGSLILFPCKGSAEIGCYSTETHGTTVRGKKRLCEMGRNYFYMLNLSSLNHFESPSRDRGFLWRKSRMQILVSAWASGVFSRGRGQMSKLLLLGLNLCGKAMPLIGGEGGNRPLPAPI